MELQDVRGPRGARVHIVPEYRRRLKHAVLSVGDGDLSTEYQEQILSRLPEYTEVDLLVPRQRHKDVARWLQGSPYRQRVHPVVYDPQRRTGMRLYLLLPDEDDLVPVDTGDYDVGSQFGTLWAQDLFEAAVAPDGRTLLLVSCAHKCFSSAEDRTDRKVLSDNLYLDRLDSEDVKVRRLPLAFKGGNVLVDDVLGRRIVFCGADSIRVSRIAWRTLRGEELSDHMIAAMFEEVLGADRVVIVGGSRPQPERMYHLDQAMMPLHDRVAAVARIVGQRPRLEPDAARVRHVETFLDELRQTLSKLGYTLVDIETTVDNVLHYQHYVNAVPYVDDRTGKRTILMPVFRNAQTDRDRELVRKNTEKLESLGYTIVHVETTADELYGGIHCLINVLQ